MDWFWNETYVDYGPLPSYETVILEETPKYVLLKDGLGATVRYFKEHNTGFDTRQWLEFRVKNLEDFKELKRRFIPESPRRYPYRWKPYAKLSKYREAPYRTVIPGQFWWTRDYVGLHNLLKFFYTKPSLIHEMMDFCTDFVIETIHPLLDEAEIDSAMIQEDMSYKTGPMISPSFFKEFMFANYQRLARFLKEHGIKVIFWDSDGDPGPVLDLIVKTGINGWVPMEIASDVDPLEIRKRFPKLVLWGGIDKRIIAFGKKEDIKKEITKKVPFLLREGGYLPTIDHAVAPETPLSNYIYYLHELKKCGVGTEKLRQV
jgi:uroporphyrinogen decarboxylase